MSVFTLYRFYDDDDTLLYVGLTINPGKRMERHKSDKEWWTEVARIEMEQHLDLEALQTAERIAIQTEKPVHNIRHAETAPQKISNAEKRRTIEWLGYRCISNKGAGCFVRPERPGVFYTRAAAWTQTQR